MKALLKGRDRKVEVIPCGVNLYLFYPFDNEAARKRPEETNKYRFREGKKYILFSSSFSLNVKNPERAKKATESLGGGNYELNELKGYSGEFHNGNFRNNLYKNGNDLFFCFLIVSQKKER